MTLTIIIILIIIGLALIVAEIFLVPGTTFVGFIGAAMTLVGIVFAFIQLDTMLAVGLTGGTVLLTIILGYYGLKEKNLYRFAVKSEIDGKIIDPVHNLQEGSKGTTITPCNPIGKAKFGDKIEEVYSLTDFIETNNSIQIVSIKENKIFVQVI